MGSPRARIDLDVARELGEPLSALALELALVHERLPAYACVRLGSALRRMDQHLAAMERVVHGIVDLADGATPEQRELGPIELGAFVDTVVERVTPAMERGRVVIETAGAAIVLANTLRTACVIASFLHDAFAREPRHRITLRLECRDSVAELTMSSSAVRYVLALPLIG